MKRKSTLILIAALVLAVTIPVFAFAAGNGRNADASTGRVSGRSTPVSAVQQGAQLMLQDCDDPETCDCEALGTGLGADGEALHQNARFTDGQYLNLNYGSGAQAFTRGGRSVTFHSGICPWAE